MADAQNPKPRRVDYRKLAFNHWEKLGQVVCAHCGFPIISNRVVTIAT